MRTKTIQAIYAIKNLKNNKLYIGSAVDLKDRWWLHKYQLYLNKHHNRYLQRAYNKYEMENFDFIILELVENKNELLNREQFWLDFYRSYERDKGYNAYSIAGSALGHKHNEKTKAKMKNRIVSKGARKAVSNANKKRVGWKYNVTKEHTWRACKCDDCKERSRLMRLKRYRKQIIPFIMVDAKI